MTSPVNVWLRLPIHRCVAREMDTAIATRKRPAMVEWHFIALGKLWENAFIESFNVKLRDELLNESLVHITRSSPQTACRLETRLQYQSPPLKTRLAHPSEFAQSASPAKAMVTGAAILDVYAPMAIAPPPNRAIMKNRVYLQLVHSWGSGHAH
jgi:Integrase core domain